jgi:hypothetical protein
MLAGYPFMEVCLDDAPIIQRTRSMALHALLVVFWALRRSRSAESRVILLT